MNFDFMLDDEKDNEFEFGNTLLKSDKKNRSKLRRRKRTFEKTFQDRNSACSKNMRTNMSDNSTSSNPQIDASVDPSICSSLSPSSQSKNTKRNASSVSIEKYSRRRRRRIGRQQEEDSSSNDDDESFSARSEIASSCGVSSSSDITRDSFSTVNSYSTAKRNRLSVFRGAGSSVHAVQDAGTYQMIRDECSYLCSTILSKRTRSLKTIDAAIELATLLSSRKTRSMLWQGVTHDVDGNDSVKDDTQRIGSSSENCSLDPIEKMKKRSPIPKVWSSILDVLALATTTDIFFDTTSSDCSFGGSTSSSTATGSIMAPTALPSTKYRTKSARRKEKELLETNGGTITSRSQSNRATTKTQRSVASNDSILSPILKDVLACIFYFVSWDCTMSREHSIAAMGAVKSCAIARRMRLAILENGSALNGIIRLMAPSQPLAAITTTETKDPSVSTLRATTVTIPKRSLTSEPIKSSPSKANGLQNSTNGTSSIRKQVKTSYSSKERDPTAMGRRRKNRRKLKEESCSEYSFHNTPPNINGIDSILTQTKFVEESEMRKIMPPPSNRSVASLRSRDRGSDELSFDDLSIQKRPFQNTREACETDDGRTSIIPDTSVVETSTYSSSLIRKVVSLRTKIHIESLSKSRSPETAKVRFGPEADNEESNCFRRNFLANNSTFLEGDRPWSSIVCLESLTRILTGKELHGKTSCLEEEQTSRSEAVEDKDSDGSDDNFTNVVMVTNRLIGKSGVIPLLSCAMSQSMKLVTKLVFSASCQKDQNARSRSIGLDDACWDYCCNRLKLLASLIDEACFFSERNRRNFCEDDPFSFQDRKKGLIFHILVYLHQCSRYNLSYLDQKRSEIMTLALRTLTSLTHDNPLAAKQMETCNRCDVDSHYASDTDKNIQGICVLAHLVFQLEESPLLNPPKPSIPSAMHIKSASDHDMHRYDGTIFCFTTLANITEGADIGKILMEMKVELNCGKILSWVEWLCHWLIKQTETFRQEILSIGNSKKLRSGNFSATISEEENRDLQKDEEEKLIAAGNGCVVLACLATESEDRDPDFSFRVRKLIKEQMPFSSDGSPSGLLLIVNTLKAYCNYYHISLGELSVAVVAPVKKLITELEEIVKIDLDPQLS